MKISPPNFKTWPKSLDLNAWMKFWYPWICNTLKISKESDEKALSTIINTVEVKCLQEQIIKEELADKEVHVFGPAMKKAALENYQKSVIVSVEGITGAFLEKGFIPNVVVTDLDSNHELLAKAGQKGALLLIHIHGDNLELVKSFLQTYELNRVILTTQTMPRKWVKNYLGFTDGDRAAFFAKSMGVRRIHLHGFSLDGPIAIQNKLIRKKEEWRKRKHVKLQIAKTLLCWLGTFIEIRDHDWKTSWPSTCNIKAIGKGVE